MEPGCSQQCPMQGQEAVGTTGAREAPPEHQEHFFAVQVTACKYRLPRGSKISFLEISKSLLDMALGPLLWVTLLEQRLGQMDPEVSASLGHVVILSLSCSWFWIKCIHLGSRRRNNIGIILKVLYNSYRTWVWLANLFHSGSGEHQAFSWRLAGALQSTTGGWICIFSTSLGQHCLAPCLGTSGPFQLGADRLHKTT